MKCSKCKIEFNGCLRKEDNEVYKAVLDSFLTEKTCFPKSTHSRV